MIGQFLRFAVIGGGSGVVNVVLYVLLRAWWPPLAANLVALAVATVANTEANRRFTFAPEGGSSLRTHAKGLLSFVLYYAFTSGALLLLHHLVRNPSHLTESIVLLSASIAGTAGRFLFLRSLLQPEVEMTNDSAAAHDDGPLLQVCHPEKSLSEIGADLQPAMFATVRHDGPGTMMGVARLADDGTAWERHNDGDEVLFVIAGRATFTARRDGRSGSVDVGPGDLLRVPAGTAHATIAHEPFDVVFLTPATGYEGWSEEKDAS